MIVRKSNVYNYDNGTETKHTLNANGVLEYTTIVNDNKGFSLKVCDACEFLRELSVSLIRIRRPSIWTRRKVLAGYRRHNRKLAPICKQC